jgi:hypothetical protein
VKIEAGNKYTIAVTARDSTTKGYYYVTLLDDTVKNLFTDSLNKLKYKLKDLYLYEKVGDKTVRYDLRADTSGKVGFHVDTLRYKGTAPLSAKVGYEPWDAQSFNEKKEVILLNYTKESGERFIEVRVDTVNGNGKGEGLGDTTYVIQIFNNDNYLKDLHLSYDRDGENPLELTSGLSDKVTEYTSVKVDWNIRSFSVWATTRDEKAKVNGFDTLKGKFHKQFYFKKEPGVPEIFEVPVWAEDSTLIRNYKVTVRRKWNPNLDSVIFSWSGNVIKCFSASDLAKSDVFNVSVPMDVEVEDIKLVSDEKSRDYYNVSKILKIVDGKYSYIIKVSSVDREDSKVDKTHMFNLSHPSMDAFLSSLLITTGGELSPAFDPNIIEYSVRVPHEQNSINFVAVTRDELATVRGAREHSLEVGVQILPIIVTAEYGNTKTYTVTVTRESATGILLPGVSDKQVYVSGQSLHVSMPVAERVSVYSAGGNLLYSLDKPAGKASVSGLPKGILIVKGSSSWVEKAVVR